jgi:hypothetical protein
MQASNPTELDNEVVSEPSLSESASKRLPRNPSQSREGYGFRSGLATPQIVQDEEGREASSPIPDQYGLGWPGEYFNEISDRIH